MKFLVRFVIGIFILSVLLLASCTKQPYPSISLPQAMTGLAKNIADSKAVPSSGAASWTMQQTNLFRMVVQANQCAQSTADPIVVSVMGDVTMTLNGQYTMSGGFTIGAQGTTPSATISMSKSRETGQTLSIPVSFMALSLLPNVVFSREMEYISRAVIDPKNVTPELMVMQKEAMADRAALQDIIRPLVQNWEMDACPQVPFVKPLMGVTHR